MQHQLFLKSPHCALIDKNCKKYNKKQTQKQENENEKNETRKNVYLEHKRVTIENDKRQITWNF